MSSPPTIWILAGEASGDQYGARLAQELKRLRAGTVVKGMGGGAMRKAGVEILVDSTELAVVGLVEVLKQLRTFLHVFKSLREQAERERPDCVVLIDYPGFNLRFAEKMHRSGIPVVYYVSPQVWAWGKKRIPKLVEYCDRMLVIFPFEVDVFRGTGLDVEFVGHPLIEILRDSQLPAVQRDPDSVLLLAGSRKNEVRNLLPPMLKAAVWIARRKPESKFVISLHDDSLKPLVEKILSKHLRGNSPLRDHVEIVVGRTREWLQRAGSGIAASGTVTVEAAIMGLPLVVVYKVNPITYRLATLLVKIPYITMTNLVANKTVYEEFVQKNLKAKAIGSALLAIQPGGHRHEEVVQGMRDTVAALGGQTDICENAARAVLEIASD
jgi:lipid-A-disaccharide synthase